MRPIVRRLGLALLVSGIGGLLFAEAPIALVASKGTRTKLVVDAGAYLGTPYRYGGADEKGFDCSGLVYRVYKDVLGVTLPRTAKTLHDYVESVALPRLQPGDLVFFDTTGPLAHVGIYAGEGEFIHAASDGARTGVIRSSLAEPYWRQAFADAGRVVTPAGYVGLVLNAGAGAGFGSGGGWRGLVAAAALTLPLGPAELGLRVAPEWDAALGVLRVPIQLVVGLDRSLRFFAGPALTLGQPTLTSASGSTALDPAGGWLASAGLAWTPWEWRVAEAAWRLTGTLTFDRYVARDASTAPGALALGGASIKAGLLVELRTLI